MSLNCFSMISGYYTALERTMFFDHVDDASLKLWQVNVEVHEAGLALVKPGIRCCDIAHELNKIYEKYDLLKYRTFGYGHSFSVYCRTTMAAKPVWNCAKTSKPYWNRAWWFLSNR